MCHTLSKEAFCYTFPRDHFNSSIWSLWPSPFQNSSNMLRNSSIQATFSWITDFETKISPRVSRTSSPEADLERCWSLPSSFDLHG
ncbi:hypothetical protein V6Z12_A08G143500 [Gossypium hirsutum]